MVAAASAGFASTQLFARRPIVRQALIETCDPLVVNDHFAREFAPHEIEVTNRPRRFSTIAHKAAMGGATLYQVASSADVRITTGPVGDFFLFYIPLEGRVRIKRASGEIEILPGQIGIVNPSDRYSLGKLDNCTQITLKFRRSEMESQAVEMIGRPLSARILFDSAKPVSFETCPMLLRLVDMLHANLFGFDAALGDPLYSGPAEALLARVILSGLPNSQCLPVPGGANGTSSNPAPYYVVRAERAIAADPQGKLTISELVEASGVSARSLFAGFREFRGISPMRHLKQVRLDHVREELVRIARNEARRRTVMAVAGDWGFNHMGSFSAAYRERFGERPSETLLGMQR